VELCQACGFCKEGTDCSRTDVSHFGGLLILVDASNLKESFLPGTVVVLQERHEGDT
jgi:hypothetical protein